MRVKSSTRLDLQEPPSAMQGVSLGPGVAEFQILKNLPRSLPWSTMRAVFQIFENLPHARSLPGPTMRVVSQRAAVAMRGASQRAAAASASRGLSRLARFVQCHAGCAALHPHPAVSRGCGDSRSSRQKFPRFQPADVVFPMRHNAGASVLPARPRRGRPCFQSGSLAR